MTVGWSIGSQWQRWDPHLHAPGTLRNDQFGTDWNGYFTRIEAARPAPIALGVTDYFSMRAYERVVEARREGRLKNVALVFANIEIRLTIKTRDRQGINLHLLVAPDDPEHVARMKEKLSRLPFHYRQEPYSCNEDGLVRLDRAHRGEPMLASEAALREGVNQFKIELSDLRKLAEGDGWIRENVLFAVAEGNDGLAGLADDAAFHAQREELGRFAHLVFSGNPSESRAHLGASASRSIASASSNRQTIVGRDTSA